MKMEELFESIEPLLEDAGKAEENLEIEPKSQFARRVYIRTLFAYIEGAVWMLKVACLKAIPKQNRTRLMGIDEVSILLEKRYQLKNNGKIKTSHLNLNLLDNIKFIFKYINHTFAGDIDLQEGKEVWKYLKDAKEIRNRLSHPKKVSDLEISDNEIEVCQDVCSWFIITMKEALETMIKSGSR